MYAWDALSDFAKDSKEPGITATQASILPNYDYCSDFIHK